MSGIQEPLTSFRQGSFGAERTPEPFADGDCHTPSTPRPRLRLKRRHDPQHLVAPTQQFLASVAAADVPMPSIEEPAIADFESDTMHWCNLEHMDDDHDTDGALRIPFSHIKASTPKTPAISDPPSLTPSRFPKWTIDWMNSCESSPEPESRPSTARSSRTSRSSFSQLSSCFSDDDVQYSPEISGFESFMSFASEGIRPGLLHPQGMRRLPRKAPWTKAMNAHLWATYNIYLSDPRVTPFQIGKSGLPPEGVCKRVAREAARSWKGSRSVANHANGSDSKSGSSTPTAESSGAYIEWPHTGAATRAQLRILCKQKARGPDGGKMRFSYFSRSPTPFTSTTARLVRKATPGTVIPPFETYEMSRSLAICTSEAMDPDGPLAQLTNSAPDSPTATAPANLAHIPRPEVHVEPSPEERRRLGSPINAKSYGPSSSSSLSDVFGLPESADQRQTHTVGPRRRLQSPVRLSRSSTQKRKTRQAHEARKRPSLSIDTWLDPDIGGDHLLGHKKSFSLSFGDEALFTSRSQPSLHLGTAQTANSHSPTTTVIPIATPPRLGSPFSGSCASFSVPNRLTQPSDFDAAMAPRRCSTVHPIRGSHPDEPASVNLASRLAYIDQRLKDFNQPHNRRRSQSPI